MDTAERLELATRNTAEVVEESELEALFDGQKTAQEALDDAVRRGNEVLREFERANR